MCARLFFVFFYLFIFFIPPYQNILLLRRRRLILGSLLRAKLLVYSIRLRELYYNIVLLCYGVVYCNIVDRVPPVDDHECMYNIMMRLGTIKTIILSLSIKFTQFYHHILRQCNKITGTQHRLVISLYSWIFYLFKTK